MLINFLHRTGNKEPSNSVSARKEPMTLTAVMCLIELEGISRGQQIQLLHFISAKNASEISTGIACNQ